MLTSGDWPKAATVLSRQPDAAQPSTAQCPWEISPHRLGVDQISDVVILLWLLFGDERPKVPQLQGYQVNDLWQPSQLPLGGLHIALQIEAPLKPCITKPQQTMSIVLGVKAEDTCRH